MIPTEGPEPPGSALRYGHPWADLPSERDPIRRARARLPAPVTVWTAGDTEWAGLTVSSLVLAQGEPGRLVGLVTHETIAGMIMFSDGSVYHLNISWALPVTWPGAVYSLEVGINGTHGVLTIDDTHRDMVLAVSKPQLEGYNPDTSRLVDFMGSYPPGDMALGELRGPMADETVSWLNRMALGVPTQACTAAEAHRNLMLTKALDLSAKRKEPVKLPL